MKVLSIHPVDRVVVKGRLSDGSDRRELVCDYTVSLCDNGRIYEYTFLNDEPDDIIINQMFADGHFIDITNGKGKLAALELKNEELQKRISNAEIALADLLSVYTHNSKIASE